RLSKAAQFHMSVRKLDRRIVRGDRRVIPGTAKRRIGTERTVSFGWVLRLQHQIPYLDPRKIVFRKLVGCLFQRPLLSRESLSPLICSISLTPGFDHALVRYDCYIVSTDLICTALPHQKDLVECHPESF